MMRKCREKCAMPSKALLPYVPARNESAKMSRNTPGGKTTFRGVPFQWNHMIRYLPLRDEMMGFPCGSDGKESACDAGDLGSIPGLGRSPGGGHGNPLQSSCLENPHGQRSLVGYSPRGRRESDTTE